MPWRFSFRALMITITLLMMGLAAMVSPWPIAAQAAALVGQLLLAVAVICACVLPKESKPFWIGFAVLGIWYWSSLSVNDLASSSNYPSAPVWQRTRLLGGFQTSGSFSGDAQLPTTNGLDWLLTMFHRRLAVGSAVSAQYAGGSYYPGVIDDVESGMYLIRWTDGSSSPAQWTSPAQISQLGGIYNFRLAGHTIFCGLFGILGGALAMWIASAAKEKAESGERSANATLVRTAPSGRG